METHDSATQVRISTASSRAEQRRVISTLTSAFWQDPAARWLFPDGERFEEDFSSFVKAFGGPAFESGGAHYADEIHGAALWFAPGIEPDKEAIVAVIERTAPSGRLDDAFGVFGQMDGFHPSFPHWYLPLIGVEPAHQGRGIGSRLLREVLDECDRLGMPAYLESSSPANLPLYERHGFEVLGEIQAGDSPVIYPMLRNC